MHRVRVEFRKLAKLYGPSEFLSCMLLYIQRTVWSIDFSFALYSSLSAAQWQHRYYSESGYSDPGTTVQFGWGLGSDYGVRVRVQVGG